MSEKPEINKSINVLVIDDHALTRDMVKSIIKGMGFRNIFHADSGKAALEEIKTRKIQLVVCDWNMPNGSGIEFLREMRSLDTYKTTPFLMLTAEAYRENVKEAIEAGVSDYIAKPFTADTLAKKIELILKN